jgi:hypothetical protein
MALTPEQIEQYRQRGVTHGKETKAFLSNIFAGGQKKAAEIEASTPTAEERLEPVAQATEDLATAGEEHVAGERDVTAENLERARTQERDQERGQAVGMDKFNEADLAAEVGLKDVQRTIDDTRKGIDTLPEDVKAEFDEGQKKLDAGLDAARTGLGEQRTEALSGVMQGRASAMDAATDSIHGAINQQISQIDAQVQQGTLSPSQAQMMKHKVKMGGAMQLSAAVGQTAHMFTQTQAQVATSFGSMFTQFEGTAAQVQGQFGAQAAGAFGQANAAKAQFNTELTKLGAQAVASRDATLSQNAAARGAFINAGDQNNIAMMDYTQDTYVSAYPVAINNLTATRDLAGDYIRSDEFGKSLAVMMQNLDETEKNNLWNIGIEVIKQFL